MPVAEAGSSQKLLVNVWDLGGQYEYMERANRRLAILVPITLALIFLLLFVHFRSAEEALLLMPRTS